MTQAYEQRTTYDACGRIFQEFDASGDYYGSQMVYGEYGHLEAIGEARDGAPGPGWNPRVYWQLEAVDARGHIIQAQMGNGMRVFAGHDPATGELVPTSLYSPRMLSSTLASRLRSVSDSCPMRLTI